MGTLAAAAVDADGLEGINLEGLGEAQDIGDGDRSFVRSVPPPPSEVTISTIGTGTTTSTATKEEPPKPKKGYMYRPTNYEIGRAIENNPPQELSSSTRREEGGGGAEEGQRVRNKFHAWHLRKLLWRKESERRFNIKKGRGKKKKRQIGG